MRICILLRGGLTICVWQVLDYSLEDKIGMDVIDSKVAMVSGVNRWGIVTKARSALPQ